MMMLAPFAFFLLAIVGAPQTPEESASDFLEAFRQMDEERFDSFFAPDVTMFFPDGPFPQGRVEGRDAVLAAFHRFFALARERGRNGLNIEPLDLQVRAHEDVAIVTFRLETEETLGRRSLILQRMGEEWRIVHFHASTIER